MGDFRRTFSVPRLWIILAIGTAVMFSALLALGWEIYQKAPPIPDVVRSESGQVIYDRENIIRGQQVWQSIDGMQQNGSGQSKPGGGIKPTISFSRKRLKAVAKSGLPVGYQAIAASGRDKTATAFSRFLEKEIVGFIPPPGFD